MPAFPLNPVAGLRACEQPGTGLSGGLVPYKTTSESKFFSDNGIQIDFAPNLVAERRVNRLKRSVWASGHLHGLAENGFRPSVCHFVTLTYAQANSWAPEHISGALKGYRAWCNAHGVACRYTWVAEIQPRRLERTGEAVVHYHLLAWLPPGVSMPHWDRPTKKRGGERSPFWSHGMTNTERAKSGVGYLMKYLSKLGEMSRFPKGLRLYGIGGLTHDGRAVRTWFNLPQWAKEFYGVGELVRKGSGLVVRATGEILEPAYSVTHIPGGIVLKALREVPKRFAESVGRIGAYSAVVFA